MQKHAEKQFGKFLSYSLGKCPDLAAKIAVRLTSLLESNWSNNQQIVTINTAEKISSYRKSRIHF